MVNPRLPNTKREEVWRGGPPTTYTHTIHVSGQFMTTSAEVTLNGGLVRDSTRAVSCTVRESLQNPLNSGLGIILICPAVWYIHLHLVDLYGFHVGENTIVPWIPWDIYTHIHGPLDDGILITDPKSCPKKGRSHELCRCRHSRWAFHPSLLVREILITRWAHFGVITFLSRVT